MSLSWAAVYALRDAELEGVCVTAEGRDLYVENAEPSPSLAAALREHRAEIVAWLSKAEPP